MWKQRLFFCSPLLYTININMCGSFHSLYLRYYVHTGMKFTQNTISHTIDLQKPGSLLTIMLLKRQSQSTCSILLPCSFHYISLALKGSPLSSQRVHVANQFKLCHHHAFHPCALEFWKMETFFYSLDHILGIENLQWKSTDKNHIKKEYITSVSYSSWKISA